MVVHTIFYEHAPSSRSLPACDLGIAYHQTAEEFPTLTTIQTRDQMTMRSAKDEKVGKGAKDPEMNYTGQVNTLSESAENWRRFRIRATTFHRFLDLPKEIRESIWDHSLRDEPFLVCGYE